MPPHARTTSAEATHAANEGYRQAGGLALADAIAIHDAIHDPKITSVTLSTGLALPIFLSSNGTRRADLFVESVGRVVCKFMAQNTKKSSAAAQRAKAGARITHILPLDDKGRHTPPSYASDWGCIEEGKLTKNSSAILNQNDVRAVAPDKASAALAQRKRKIDEQEAEQQAGRRLWLEVPFGEKQDARQLGAKWDAVRSPQHAHPHA